MDSNSTIVLNATEDGEKLLPDQRTEVVNAEVTEETNQFNLVEDLSSKENPTRKPMKVLSEPTDDVSQWKNILVLSPISAGPTLAPGICGSTFPLPPKKTSHVFISYPWAKDEEGRDNHLRANYLNDTLKRRGIVTWFDSDRIGLDANSLRNTLAKALYATCCVLICITRQYEVKVNRGDESDCCLYELDIASASPTLANKRIPVVMERSMLDLSKWEEGRLRAEFGHKLYTDLSRDDNFEENCEMIVQKIIKMLGLQQPPTMNL